MARTTDHHRVSTCSPSLSMRRPSTAPRRYLMSTDVILYTAYRTVTALPFTNDASFPDVSVSSPIQYHRVCIDNTSLLCFRDEMYLCVCGLNYTHVECFLYNDQLDRCTHCLAGGRCLRGDHNQSNDFLCLCPSCYSGRRCQFNSKSFAFTPATEIYTDLTSPTKARTTALLIVFSLLPFVVAIPNNLFAFTTFQRSACLRTGVGHYLLCLSLVNQITLALLIARLTLIILGLLIGSTHPTVADILCKVLNYSLSCFARLSLWFATFVALERVYTTTFLTGQWFKQPHIARRLMLGTVAVIFITASYELVFTKSFSSMDDRSGVICVTEFPFRHQSMWTILHQMISITNFLLPLVINVCCTCTIVGVVIRTKMNLQRRRAGDLCSVSPTVSS